MMRTATTANSGSPDESAQTKAMVAMNGPDSHRVVAVVVNPNCPETAGN